MRFVCIAVMDSDTEYAERLAAYARMPSIAGKFRLDFWTRENLEREHAPAQLPDVVLVSADLSDALPKPLEDRCCVLVDDPHAGRRSKEQGWPTIERYQPMDTFFGHLGALVDAYVDPSERREARSANVISVFSASGGAGKSVVAANLAVRLALRGEPTFFASFERVPSEPWFTGGSVEALQQFEKLVYYLRKGDSALSERLATVINIDSASGLHFLPPSVQTAEMKMFMPADALQLVDLLAAGGLYSNLVFDLETGTDDVTMALLAKSDAAIWLMTDDPASRAKTGTLDAYLSAADVLPERVGLVLNKFTGTMSGKWEGKRRLFGELPYVPAWKQAIGHSALIGEPVFYGRLLGLYDLLCGKGRERYA